MNFGSPGWFDRYMAFRHQHPFAHRLPTHGVRLLDDAATHNEQDQAIYYFLQPTGLLYGFPVTSPYPGQAYPESKYFDAAARVRLIFLEALFSCMVADRHALLEGMSDEQNHLRPAALLTTYFFNHDPARTRGGWRWFMPPMTWLERRENAARRFEAAVAHQIDRGTRLLNIPEYYNSFLFLELYYCIQWQRQMLVEPMRRRELLNEAAIKRLELRNTLLDLQIAAAHASGGVDEKEFRVFDQFLRASGLPGARQAALRGRMRDGLKLEDIHIPSMPWLVRRYFLESIMMVLIVDGVVDSVEREFAARLVEKLGLWREELGQSLGALESFMVHQDERLHLTRSRSHARRLADRLQERASAAIRRNVDRLANEVRETHELYELLMKSARTALSPEEKEKVRSQLFDIMKTIPALAIFALPGGGVILPILIRLLPFNLLPSSFED